MSSLAWLPIPDRIRIVRSRTLRNQLQHSFVVRERRVAVRRTVAAFETDILSDAARAENYFGMAYNGRACLRMIALGSVDDSQVLAVQRFPQDMIVGWNGWDDDRRQRNGRKHPQPVQTLPLIPYVLGCASCVSRLRRQPSP